MSARSRRGSAAERHPWCRQRARQQIRRRARQL